MRRRARVATSVVCGVAAALLAMGGAQSARTEAQRERSELLERYGGEVASLVVARRELASGSVVSETDVEERDWLADLAPEGAFTSVGDIVGTRLTSSVAKGAPLTRLSVASGEGDVEVPEGRVAISARVGERVGIPADVASGARVLVYEAAGDGVRLVCADALVLGGSAGRSSSDASITLAVYPDEVSGVLAASAAGTLRVALPADDVVAQAQTAGEQAPTSVAPETGGES